MAVEENEKNTAEEMSSSGRGEITVRHNKKKDFIAKILCVIVAFGIWYFASDNDITVFEKEITSVPVEVRGESEYSILSGDGVTVNVTVSGKRSTVNNIKSSDIKAYVDISAVTGPGESKLPIKYEIPSGLSYVGGSSELLIVYMDKTASVQVPVEVNVLKYLLKDGYQIGFDDIVADISSVMITGPETVVSSVSCARLDADLGNAYIDRGITYSGKLVLADALGGNIVNNYISISDPAVKATIPVYVKKNIPVSVGFAHGFYNDKNCKVTVTPAVIGVIGDVDSIDAVDFSFILDESEITGKKEYSFDITVPESVRLEEEFEEINIKVEPIGMELRSGMKAGSYTVSGGTDDGISVTSLPSVSLYGERAYVKKVTADDISLDIDVSDINGGKASATVVLSPDCKGKVYAVGTYSVKVNTAR